MGEPMIVAPVTTAFAQIVQHAIESVVKDAKVLMCRPDPNAKPACRIHLFLYQVLPMHGISNTDLPVKSSDGKLVIHNTGTIDLNYLMAFYGSESELEPQRMLDAVIQFLNHAPGLSPSMLQQAIDNQPSLVGSNLVDNVEGANITPFSVSLEQMTKLWSLLCPIPYALSALFRARVLWTENEMVDDTPMARARALLLNPAVAVAAASLARKLGQERQSRKADEVQLAILKAQADAEIEEAAAESNKDNYDAAKKVLEDALMLIVEHAEMVAQQIRSIQQA